MDTVDQSVDPNFTSRTMRLGGIILAVIAFVASLAVLPACNTVEGVGQDVQAAGEGIEDAAD